MSYERPNPGDKVRVTIEGYVYGPATNGISITPTPADGGHIPQRVQMYWDYDYPAESTPTVEILEAAYVPQLGDVALWESEDKNDPPTMVTYCQVTSEHKGWYMGGYSYSTLISTNVDYRSPRFRLVARDGQTVSYTPKAAPSQESFEEDRYVPRAGDVGTYRTASGTVVTVVYRRHDATPHGPRDWYSTRGVQSTAAHKDKSFQLILRDGVLQEGINV